MIWLSALLVCAAAGVFMANVSAQGPELRFGFEQMIHARVPWLLLGMLWGGLGVGVWALVRRRRWFHWAIVAFELVPVAFLSAYFLRLSFLPPHTLAVEVGDPFPAYSLVDQDGRIRSVEALAPREPALYVFYRGNW